mgnify:CR=1 FL=1
MAEKRGIFDFKPSFMCDQEIIRNRVYDTTGGIGWETIRHLA